MANLAVGSGTPRFWSSITLPGTIVCAPGAVTEVDITVPGVKTDMLVVANKPTQDVGVYLHSGGTRVKSSGVLQVVFENKSGGPVTLAAQDIFVIGF